MRKLTLKKPICFFDLETTGLSQVNDKIVSIAITKINPTGKRERFYTLINPGIPIPPHSSAIHGITDEMVKNQQSFSEWAPFILNFLEGSDLAGFNSNSFDIPFLSCEFSRCEITFPKTDTDFLDVGNMYKKLNPRNLSAAVKEYTGKDIDGAHNAEVDVNATIDVFMGMIQRHGELPLTIEELSAYSDMNPSKVDLMGKFTKNELGQYMYTFGKHKGEIITYVNAGYLGWIQNNDFHPETKNWAEKIYNEVINSKN